MGWRRDSRGWPPCPGWRAAGRSSGGAASESRYGRLRIVHRDETVREWLKMRCRRNFEQHRAGSEGDNLPLAAEEAVRSNRAGRMGQPCGFWRPGIAKIGG